MQYKASTINRTALPRSKRMRALGAASVTPAVVNGESDDKYWNGEIDTETEEAEVSTTYPVKISKRLRIVDESGALYGSISLDANGRFVFDKGIISKEDIIAYGVGGEDVKSVTDVIEEYLAEHGVGGGGLSSVVVTSSGSGNVVSGMSKTLSDDGKTLTLTLTKGISAYVKPSTGIPLTDLASSVQTSLEKADTALQEHQSLQGYATEQWVEGKGYLTTHQSLAVERYNFSTASNVSIKQPIYTLSAVNHLNWGSQNNALIDKGALAYWNGRYNGQSSNLLYFKNGEIDSVSARNTAITNAINALDVTSVGGDGKYIQSISQTDGKISATAGTLDKTAVGLGNVNNTADANKNVEGANHILSLGKETMITGTTKPTKTGISLVEVYNNGYPSPYGNIINVRGQGSGQLLCEWTGSNATGHLKYRSLGDTVDGWSDWKTVAFTDDNVASATKLQTPRTLWGKSFDGTGNVTGALSSVTDITMTGALKYQGSKVTNDMITFLDNTADNYGNGISIGGGGLVVVGSGESASTTITSAALKGGTEKLFLTSDEDIRLIPGIQSGYDAKKGIVISSDGAVTVGEGKDGRTVKVTNSDIKFIATSQNGWAMNLVARNHADSSDLAILIGGYGNADTYNYTYLGGTYNNPSMVIKSGQIGIGTTSPQQRLHVSGASRTKYVDFYSKDGEANRAGWVGRGSDANEDLTLYSDNAAINVDSNAEINLKAVHKQVVKVGYSATSLQSYACIGASSTDCEVANLNFSVNGYESKARLQFLKNGNFYMGRNYETTIGNDNAAVRIASTGGLVLSSTAALSGTRDNAIYIRPSGSSSATNQVKFESGGVTISASSANGLVIKRTDGSYGAFVNYKAKNQDAIYWQVGSNSEHKFTFDYTSSSGTTITSKVTIDSSGNIIATGDVTAYSDRRLKSDIEDLEYRGSLSPKEYVKDGKKCIGFIAQEVRELYPELVLGEEKEDEYLSLNYGGITAVLAAENKELHKKVESLEERIEKLETLINKLIEEK